MSFYKIIFEINRVRRDVLDVHVCLLKVNSSMIFIKICQYLCSLNLKKNEKRNNTTL